MLVALSKLLSHAQKYHYAIGAFNVYNLETIQAAFEVAQEKKSPIIVQTSEGALDYAGMDELGSLVHIYSKKTSIPVCFHLDHGKNIHVIKKAINSGWYSSVMFDGSSFPFEENIKKTKELTLLAHKQNISLEAELGAIAGIEDFVSVEEKNAHLTNPNEAKQFIEQTKCDALAIAIGTKHGAFKFSHESILDFERLKQIKKMVSVPLVLHGASGISSQLLRLCKNYGCEIEDAKGVSDAHIKKAISLGICKINIDSDLRLSMISGMRKHFSQHKDNIDVRAVLNEGKNLMKKTIAQKMDLFGCSNKE